MELLRAAAIVTLVLMARGLESHDSESVSLDVQEITNEQADSQTTSQPLAWTSSSPGVRPRSPPPRVRSYQDRLGESGASQCKSCEEMGRMFAITHTQAGKPPRWGKATDHAKGCWIAMDCNLSQQASIQAPLGESSESTNSPGLSGFKGQAQQTNMAPVEGYLENGQMSAGDALYKPVEAELDYRSWDSVNWELIVNNTMFSTAQIRIVGKTWEWHAPEMEPASAQWSGTAWFIAHSAIGDGTVVDDPNELLLVTNAHVAADAVYATIMVPTAGCHGIEVEVIGTCVKRDLALLRVKDPAQLREQVNWVPAALELGDSDNMRRAGQVMVLGYPLGLAGVKASMGFVSGYQQFEDQLYLQVTAPIDGGNSGGPLLDSTGHVVGVVSAKIAQASGMSFAIPSVELKALLGALYTRRYVMLPLLGLNQAVTSSNVRDYFGIPPGAGGSNQSGLLVDSVMPQSLLSMAGVQAGDVLLSLDGASVDRYSQVWVEAIDDRVHLDTFLARKAFDEVLHLEVWRGSSSPGIESQALDLTVNYDSTPPLAVPDVPETVATPPQNVQFGGVAIMNLTTNLVETMVNSKTARFLDPSERTNEHLIVVDVVAESPAGIDGTVSPGHLVLQVNGIPVSNIAAVCHAMSIPQGDWVTLHTDRGMLIMSRKEIEEFECGPMGSFPTPNRLCTWECPTPDEADEATQFEMVGPDNYPDTSAESDDGVSTADDGVGDSTTEADATIDDDVDTATEAKVADETDAAPAAAEPSAVEVAPAAPSTIKTLGLTTRPKKVNKPNAPAAVKAFRSKIQMALP
jgi:S1-C subfamily serine protease